MAERRKAYIPKDPHALVIDGITVRTRANGGTGRIEVRFKLRPGSGDRIWLHAPDYATAEAWARSVIEAERAALTPTPPKALADGQKPKLPKVRIFTDGSNLGQPGPGGWAALLVAGDHEQLISGPLVSATNNIAELTAVLEGIKALKKPCHVQIVSDSRYVVDGINSHMPKWVKQNWSRRQGPIANLELWQALWGLMQTHRVAAVWVRGHSGHPENERVDEAAGEQSRAERIRQAEERGEVLELKPKKKKKSKALSPLSGPAELAVIK